MKSPKGYAGYLVYTDEYCTVLKYDEHSAYVSHLEELIEQLEWEARGIAEWRDLYYKECEKRIK